MQPPPSRAARSILLLVAALLWAFPARAAAPSVAVFSLEAKTGVAPETAHLISENLVEELRATGAFSRVVSGREIEDLLSFERQRQILDCAESSCVAELAGLLGVDFVVNGSLGKLGHFALFNARMLAVKSGAAASSLSLTVCGDDESLLKAVKPAVWKLVKDAGVGSGAATVAIPPPPSSCGEPSRAPTTALRASGAGLLVAAAAGALVGIAGGVAAALWGLAITSSPEFVGSIPTGGLTRTPRYVAVVAPSAVGAGVAAVALLATLGMGAGAVALLAGSAWVAP